MSNLYIFTPPSSSVASASNSCPLPNGWEKEKERFAPFAHVRLPDVSGVICRLSSKKAQHWRQIHRYISIWQPYMAALHINVMQKRASRLSPTPDQSLSRSLYLKPRFALTFIIAFYKVCNLIFPFYLCSSRSIPHPTKPSHTYLPLTPLPITSFLLNQHTVSNRNLPRIIVCTVQILPHCVCLYVCVCVCERGAHKKVSAKYNHKIFTQFICVVAYVCVSVCGA